MGNLPIFYTNLGHRFLSHILLVIRIVFMSVLVTWFRKQWFWGGFPIFSLQEPWIRVFSQKLSIMWWGFAPKTTHFPKSTSYRDLFLRFRLTSFLKPLMTSGFLQVPPFPKMSPPKSTMSEGKAIYPHLRQTFYPLLLFFVSYSLHCLCPFFSHYLFSNPNYSSYFFTNTALLGATRRVY